MTDDEVKAYFVRIASDFVVENDGYAVFWPQGNNGFYDAFVLRAIADELDRRNADWHATIMAEIGAELNPSQSPRGDSGKPDTSKVGEEKPAESPAFCFGCGFSHAEPYVDCVWNKDIG